MLSDGKAGRRGRALLKPKGCSHHRRCVCELTTQQGDSPARPRPHPTLGGTPTMLAQSTVQ